MNLTQFKPVEAKFLKHKILDLNKIVGHLRWENLSDLDLANDAASAQRTIAFHDVPIENAKKSALQNCRTNWNQEYINSEAGSHYNIFQPNLEVKLPSVPSRRNESISFRLLMPVTAVSMPICTALSAPNHRCANIAVN